MKDFSNETKNKRRKAILKVILKRYSFIIWVPILLVLVNLIGIETIKILQITDSNYIVGTFLYYIMNIAIGFFTIMCSLAIIGVIIVIIHSVIEYLKKGTIVEDLIENLKLFFEALISIPVFIIKLPKMIFLRIKDEKRRFNNSLEKELGRKEND